MAESTDVPYSIVVDKVTDININPTLITEEEIKDVGGENEPGDQWRTEYYEKTCLEAHYCSVPSVPNVPNRLCSLKSLHVKCTDKYGIYGIYCIIF